MLNRKYLIAILGILGGLSIVLVSNFRIANTQSSNKTSDNNPEIGKSDKDFPIVSLVSNQSKGIDEKRKKRNEKFDKWGWVDKSPNVEVTEVRRINDWEVGLPVLPVKKSDAVLIGTVKSGEAFLSNDETGVYSEFSVLVSNLVKDNQSSSIESGAEIIVQRAGGRILYPSGKILKYSTSGQEMPDVNGKYVFFLRYDQQGQTYNIITAYEISNGKITALDGKGKAKGSAFKFSKFNGFDERQFMNELESALYSPTDSSEEVTSP